MTDLDELQALCDAAEPGPWYNKINIRTKDGRHIAQMLFYPRNGEICGGKENGDLIAAARTALPQLIARVRELEGALASIRSGSKSCCTSIMGNCGDKASKALTGGGDE
jgi:hypothetical protein